MNEKLSFFEHKAEREAGEEEPKPIFVSLGTASDYGLDKAGSAPSEFDISQARNIDWISSESELRKNKLLNAGEGTYVISPIDNFNKFSKDFVTCTGLIVAGIDKKTGEDISFLSHQDPHALFIHLKKDSFVGHLNQRLLEMKKRCKPGSIASVIIGGRYYGETHPEIDYVLESYPDVVKLIGSEVEQILGIEPIVANGPKITHGSDRAYYDNKNRRLYLVRPRVNPDTGSFPAFEVDSQKNKWE